MWTLCGTMETAGEDAHMTYAEYIHHDYGSFLTEH